MSMRVRKVCLIIFGLIPSHQFKHILNYIRIQIVIKLAVVHQENGNGFEVNASDLIGVCEQAQIIIFDVLHVTLDDFFECLLNNGRQVHLPPFYITNVVVITQL